jgi:hypothetical protein
MLLFTLNLLCGAHIVGGKLVGAARMTPEEYREKTDILLSILKVLVDKLRLTTIMPFRKKESFGDIDLILQHKEGSELLVRKELEKLGVTEYFESDGIDDPNFSFNYENDQIDMMFFSEETFEVAKRYLSLNSLGMVIGMMCRHAGFKLGTKGLLMPVFHPERQSSCLAILTVTTDFDDVLRFLELDPKKHRDGFDTMREMHEYVSSSKYFSSNFFTLGALNHNRRRKLKHNRMYIEIKEYLSTRPEIAREILSLEDSFDRAYAHFPNLKVDVNKVLKKACKDDNKRKKLNREDMMLLFNTIPVNYTERRAFLEIMTPKVLSHANFLNLIENEKVIFFLKNNHLN